ncbi:PDZ domain-containing protein, partial [Sphingorhabdus sp.]|uniref:PDZ domain-containing protein n=1 Tax=Sphingorhabdus sp. TaxID=1902408 RepID=UPI0032B848D7
YDRYIQTDASINRGNSGGPMFDMKGQVIGINNAIISPTGGSVGIGFAIPAETASPIVEKLIKGVAIDRGYLGVDRVPVSEDLADALGIPHNQGEFIRSVVPGGAAAAADMREGDVVLRIDGQKVTPDNSLSTIIANTQPGTKVAIDILRNGKARTVYPVVAKRPSDEQILQQNFDPRQSQGGAQDDQNQPAIATQGLAAKALGLAVTPLTPQLAVRLGVREDTRGLVITGVDSSSDAATKQIQPGMIILGANNVGVASAADLDAQITAVRVASRSAILLRLQPPGQAPVHVPVRLRQ